MLRESNCLAFIGCVRLNKPVVHCLTNYVSMDFMANALSAVGASPAMVRASIFECTMNQDAWDSIPIDYSLIEEQKG